MRPQGRHLCDCPMGMGKTQEDSSLSQSSHPMQQSQGNQLDSLITCLSLFHLCSTSIECLKVVKAPVYMRGRLESFSGVVDRESELTYRNEIQV